MKVGKNKDTPDACGSSVGSAKESLCFLATED